MRLWPLMSAAGVLPPLLWGVTDIRRRYALHGSSKCNASSISTVNFDLGVKFQFVLRMASPRALLLEALQTAPLSALSCDGNVRHKGVSKGADTDQLQQLQQQEWSYTPFHSHSVAFDHAASDQSGRATK